MVVNHDIFEGRPFRGSLEFLVWYVTITVHATALMTGAEPAARLRAGLMTGWAIPTMIELEAADLSVLVGGGAGVLPGVEPVSLAPCCRLFCACACMSAHCTT